MTLNRPGNFEMRKEVLGSDGAQKMDISGNEVSDSGHTDFLFEACQLEMDAVFRPGIDNYLSPAVFNNLEMQKRGSTTLSSKNSSICPSH